MLNNGALRWHGGAPLICMASRERVSVRVAITQDFARIDLLELRDLCLSCVRRAKLSSTTYLTRSACAKGE